MSSGSWWDTEYPREGKRPITPARYLEKHADSKTDAEVAEYLSRLTGAFVSKDSVTQKRQRLGLNKTRTGKALFGESQARRFDDPPTLKTRSALVIADVHAPYHDAEWLTIVVNEARRNGITAAIVAGDLIDFQALSCFAPSVLAAEEGPLAVDADIGAAAEVVAGLLSAFETVLVLLGNHEERLARKLGQLTTEMFRRLLGADGKRATVSEYHYARIEDGAATWRVTHPRNASIIPVRVAARLTEKYESNVIAAHGHDWGEAVGASGRYAAACGMIGDPLRIDYAALSDSVRPQMQQGAWLLIDGKPVLLHPVWRRGV